MHYFETLPRPTKTYHTKPYDRIVKDHNFTGQGKTVVFTGGASGVGYHISKAFAEAGTSRIVIISRSTEPQRNESRARDEVSRNRSPSFPGFHHRPRGTKEDYHRLGDRGYPDIECRSCSWSNTCIRSQPGRTQRCFRHERARNLQHMPGTLRSPTSSIWGANHH